MWLPDPGFHLFETSRYVQRPSEKRKMAAAAVAAAAAAAYPSPSPTPQPSLSCSQTIDVGQDINILAALSAASASKTKKLEQEDCLPPLDLGIRATRDYEVNEYIRLFGSAADITDEQDDEMRMDTSQLKADVGY